MAVNIPGLIAVIIFYIVIFVIGVVAARIQTKKNHSQHVRDDEEVMLAGRNLGWFVGCFTMTGIIFYFDIKFLPSKYNSPHRRLERHFVVVPAVHYSRM